MSRIRKGLLSGLVVACLLSGARAQEATTQPAGAGAATKPRPLVATVKEVKGAAQYLKAGEGEKWRPLKVGDKLDELGIIRTGFRTRVVLAFADNSEVVINRATKMGIAQFRKVGKVTRTRIGLKYGSMRMNISKARGPSDFAVSTPVATLAVSGSGSDTGFSDFGLLLGVFAGDWLTNMGPKHLNVVAGETTDGRLTRAIFRTKLRTAVLLGDVFGGLGPVELNSMIFYGGGRGSIGFAGAGWGSHNTLRPSGDMLPSTIRIPGLDIDIGTSNTSPN